MGGSSGRGKGDGEHHTAGQGRTFKIRWVTWGQIRLVFYRSHFMFPDPVRVSSRRRAGGVAVALTVTTALGSTVIKGRRLTVDCIPTSVSIADSNCPRRSS